MKNQSLQVGMLVGRCKNCSHSIELRQPWLSRMLIVKDGYYLVHCNNEDCHNYYGMELLESEFDIADFVEWDEEHPVRNGEAEKMASGNIIPFEKKSCRIYC